MTSKQIVDLIRSDIKKLIPSESYQDPYLWRKFILSKNEILRQQLDRRNKISELAYHTVCLDLVQSNKDECCLDLNCSILKSNKKLPNYLTTSNSNTIQIMDKNNKVISLLDPTNLEDDLKYKQGLIGKPASFISNGYLFLVNSNLKKIKVKALWSDPLSLLNIQSCDDTTNDCIKDNESFMMIDDSLLFRMINLTVQTMTNGIADNTGDNNEQV